MRHLQHNTISTSTSLMMSSDLCQQNPLQILETIWELFEILKFFQGKKDQIESHPACVSKDVMTGFAYEPSVLSDPGSPRPDLRRLRANLTLIPTHRMEDPAKAEQAPSTKTVDGVEPAQAYLPDEDTAATHESDPRLDADLPDGPEGEGTQPSDEHAQDAHLAEHHDEHEEPPSEEVMAHEQSQEAGVELEHVPAQVSEDQDLVMEDGTHQEEVVHHDAHHVSVTQAEEAGARQDEGQQEDAKMEEVKMEEVEQQEEVVQHGELVHQEEIAQHEEPEPAQEDMEYHDNVAEQEHAAYQEAPQQKDASEQPVGAEHDTVTEQAHAAEVTHEHQQDHAVHQEEGMQHDHVRHDDASQAQAAQQELEAHSEFQAQHDHTGQNDQQVHATEQVVEGEHVHGDLPERVAAQIASQIANQVAEHVAEQEQHVSPGDAVAHDEHGVHPEHANQEGVIHEQQGPHPEHASHLEHVADQVAAAERDHAARGETVPEQDHTAAHMHNDVQGSEGEHRPMQGPDGQQGQPGHTVAQAENEALEGHDHQVVVAIAAAAEHANQGNAVQTLQQQDAVQYVPPHSEEVTEIAGRNVAPRRIPERYHPSAIQLKHLIQAFEEAPTPTAGTLTRLSNTIGMPMQNLVLWFKNRRARQKKKFPTPSSKSGKRSYVRSGVYSRNPPKRKAERSLSVPHPRDLAVAPPDVSAHSLEMQRQVEMHPMAEEGQLRHEEAKSAHELTGSKRNLTEDDNAVKLKRMRFSGVNELIGEDNPCRVWDAQECYRRCMEFFHQCTGDNHSEQMKFARGVADKFFMQECQTGLTLTSAMQPLHKSVEVLDGVMNMITEEGSLLNSGSRVVLYEFLAQIRSGKAAGNIMPEEDAAGMEGTVVEVAPASPVQ